MLDINGQELRKEGLGLLLCEILEIEADRVLLRVMNSELEICVGAHQDEVLGGLVADSELTAFVEKPQDGADSEPETEYVPVSPFE